MKQTIKHFLKEIIPIIVGILVALYINNWNEERKNEEYMKQISSSIRNELKEANKEITEKIPNQKSLIDTLNYYMSDNKISLFDIIVKNNGIRTPIIKMNAWKAISNSKIELLKYDKMTVLADIESEKGIMNQKLDKLLTLVYANLNETEKNKKFVLKVMLKDIISTENGIQELITHYKQIDAE